MVTASDNQFPLPADGILTVSWSSLRRWETCRHKQLRYAQHRTSISGKDSRMFLPGTVADRVMRSWLEQEDPQKGQMPGMVEEYLARFSDPKSDDPEAYKRIRWKGDPVEDRKSIIEFCTEVVTKLEPILFTYVVPYDYEPELKFNTIVYIPDLNGERRAIRLIGGIDIAVRLEEDRYHLFDLKATGNPDYIRKVVGQGIFYFIAWRNMKGVFPEKFGFIAPALEHQLQWATIDNDDIRAMVARIIAYAHSAWASDMPPKLDDAGCAYCEANASCDKFNPPLKQDEKGRARVSLSDAAAIREGLA